MKKMTNGRESKRFTDKEKEKKRKSKNILVVVRGLARFEEKAN